MHSRTGVNRAGCMFFILCAAVTAPAATISSTYAYTAGVTGNLANPPLIGTGSGSIVPLGSMAWSDRAFPNLATGVSTGTFTMTFNNGTLFGDFRGQTDITTPPTATLLTQVLNVTGGTGAFVWYNGTLTGSGVLNRVTSQESLSGAGTLNTTPEPAAIALLPIGLLCLVAYRRWAAQKVNF